MIKYIRKEINKNAGLHDKEFITTDDVEILLVKLLTKAIEVGADEDKMMEFFNEDGNDG